MFFQGLKSGQLEVKSNSHIDKSIMWESLYVAWVYWLKIIVNTHSICKPRSLPIWFGEFCSLHWKRSAIGVCCFRLHIFSYELLIIVCSECRQFVSLWTCSKLCAFCFAVGVVVGFTLKRRVRRWASKLLRRIKDDWFLMILLSYADLVVFSLTGRWISD